jgi:hypothetical protein
LASSFSKFLIFIVLSISLNYSKNNLRDLSLVHDSGKRPPLYLPEIDAVKLFTLGNQKPVADLFWFLTLNYFGEHYQKKDAMPWFAHMCELVISLDPKARHVYEFCGTLLSWIAKDPESSNKILNKGIEVDPTYWKYRYLKGFNEWYFLEDFSSAKETFRITSSLPHCPPVISGLTAKLISSHGSPAESIDFLRESIKSGTDQTAKKALQEKLKEAYVSRDIALLKDIVKKFETDYKRLPKSWRELVDMHYLKEEPIDPNKEIYILEPEISSKSLGEGLVFKGKTAKTGMFKNEGWK